MTPILSIALAAVFMAFLGLTLAAVLVLANKRLAVFEDPRIDQVEDLLPHANCGACGTAGCRQFAEQLVSGEVEPGQCTVNAKGMNQLIADFLGVSLGKHEKRVARLACAGGIHVARSRAEYQGLKTCRAAALVSGGGKGCTWGCLGLGDCEVVCDFNAIQMSAQGLPLVDTATCTACGDCVDVCPKQLFSIHEVSHRLWVACKNQEEGDQAEAECQVVCTACGRCAQDAPEGLIEIQDSLAVVDYGKNGLASLVAIERCPTGAIVWLDDRQGALKGRDAKRVVRRTPLPLG